MKDTIKSWLQKELDVKFIREDDDIMYFRLLNLSVEFAVFVDELRVSYLPTADLKFDFDKIAFYDKVASIIEQKLLKESLHDSQLNTL